MKFGNTSSSLWELWCRISAKHYLQSVSLKFRVPSKSPVDKARYWATANNVHRSDENYKKNCKPFRKQLTLKIIQCEQYNTEHTALSLWLKVGAKNPPTIGTWNVRSLCETGNLNNTISKMNRLRVSISETCGQNTANSS